MNFNLLQLLKGDWRYFWPETVRALAHLPSAWDSFLNTGIGQPQLGTLWITSYLNLTSFFSYLGLTWTLIGLLFWQIPVILLSVWGVQRIAKRLFRLDPVYSLLAGVLYVANTYFLLLFLGGQAGISLAYSVFPWVVCTGIDVLENPNLKKGIIFGLMVSLVLLFDPRVFYLTLLSLSLYGVFSIKKVITRPLVLYGGIIPSLVLLSLHLFWILPIILFKTTGVTGDIGSTKSFTFFSFGGFDYALSWLHPNWPENIFGKIHFLNPAFLIFPLMAFGSVLFLHKKDKKNIVYLVLLAIGSAFLAKGAKEPFSVVNIFLFEHFPGMSLFRDATKFYIPLSFSYSLLVPYTLRSVTMIVEKKAAMGKYIVPVIFLLSLLTLLSPISKNIQKLGTQIPKSYNKFHNFLSAQDDFSRTLWIPAWQRYGYFSPNHPAIGRGELLTDTTISGVTKFFARPDAQAYLKKWSIKYIIIPDDTEKELFITNNEYSEARKKEYVRVLDKTPWLKKKKTFGTLFVYEVPNPSEHFSMVDGSVILSSHYVTPSKYSVTSKNDTIQGNLIFTESFNPYWVAKIGNQTIYAKNRDGMNSFSIPAKAKDVLIEYLPQTTVTIALIISLICLIGWITTAIKAK